MIESKKIQVLLVEDSPSDALIVQDELAHTAGAQFSVVHIEFLNEALALLKAQTFDIVLLDLSLPDSHGLETFVRLNSAASGIPVVVLSGRTDEDLAVNAVQAGAQDYLVKGHMEEHVLVRSIRYAIERKRSEEALRMQSRVLESMIEGVNVSDQDGTILFSNPACDAMFGHARGTLVGQHISILSGTQAGNRGFSEEIEEGLHCTGNWSGEISNRKREGAAVLTQANITALEIGGRKCAVAVHEDITQKKQIELHLLDSQRVEGIGQLAAGVAHDFNNILGVIMGYTELIMQELSPSNSARKYSEEIMQATELAAGLTRQLLVFSRKQTVQPTILDLDVVVHDTEKMLRRLIQENVELVIVSGKKIGRVKADAGYLGQVLMNLVVNARDAMPNGGRLVIETRNVMLDEDYALAHTEVTPGNYVMLSVSDTGMGMTDEIKAHLFEAFFTTKPKGKGTGLGLATCQTVVKQCGGHMEVKSKLGNGSTFEVYFPEVDAPLDVAGEVLKKLPLPLGTETLLLVEDEPSLRNLARSVLQGQGYEVLTAANGQEGLYVANQHEGEQISLVVTDGIAKSCGHKWLDFDAMLRRMFSQHNILAIKYFTAPVTARKHDPQQPIRQQIYWRALRTLPNFEIIEGNFLTNPKRVPLERYEKYPWRAKICSLIYPDIVKNKDGVFVARVLKTEEKGSDVNLAAHLINDAHFGRFQEAIVVSGDSDLCDAVRIVVQEVGKPVCVVNPQIRVSRELRQLASHYRHVHKNDLVTCQFPNPMMDTHGTFTKPQTW